MDDYDDLKVNVNRGKDWDVNEGTLLHIQSIESELTRHSKVVAKHLRKHNETSDSEKERLTIVKEKLDEFESGVLSEIHEIRNSIHEMDSKFSVWIKRLSIVSCAALLIGIAFTGSIIWMGSHKCPNGMVDVGAFCIDQTIRFKKTKTWVDSNEGCIKAGLRMCSISELSGAARLKVIKTFKWSEGNYWAWASDAALIKSEGGDVWDACHINLNEDEPNHILGEWNCNVPANLENNNIGGICCK